MNLRFVNQKCANVCEIVHFYIVVVIYVIVIQIGMLLFKRFIHDIKNQYPAVNTVVVMILILIALSVLMAAYVWRQDEITGNYRVHMVNGGAAGGIDYVSIEGLRGWHQGEGQLQGGAPVFLF